MNQGTATEAKGRMMKPCEVYDAQDEIKMLADQKSELVKTVKALLANMEMSAEFSAGHPDMDKAYEVLRKIGVQ